MAFDNVTSLQTDTIQVALADGQWSLVSPKDQLTTHEVDNERIDSLISQLNSLRVNGFSLPLEADEPSEAQSAADGTEVDESSEGELASDGTEPAEQEELLTNTLTVVQNEAPVTLELSRKGNSATIARSDVKGLFELPVATYDALTAESLAQLIVEKSSDAL